MNAAKIIEDIRLLPEIEQGKVVEFVEELKQTKKFNISMTHLLKR